MHWWISELFFQVAVVPSTVLSLFFRAKCEIKYIQLEVAYAIIKKKVTGELLMESFSILIVFHLDDFGFQV